MWDSVSNPSQTTHKTNDYGRHTSIVKGKRALLANNIIFRWIVWWTQWQSCFRNWVIRLFDCFCWTHFGIFVRKFLVQLRTVYASPQKLARPLFIIHTPANYLPGTAKHKKKPMKGHLGLRRGSQLLLLESSQQRQAANDNCYRSLKNNQWTSWKKLCTIMFWWASGGNRVKSLNDVVFLCWRPHEKWLRCVVWQNDAAHGTQNRTAFSWMPQCMSFVADGPKWKNSVWMSYSAKLLLITRERAVFEK